LATGLFWKKCNVIIMQYYWATGIFWQCPLPSTSRGGELAPSLIVIPCDLLLMSSSENMSAIIDSVYDDFGWKYDGPYLAGHAILC
jgi:hypothetical protein